MADSTHPNIIHTSASPGPHDAPPSYDQATGSSTTSHRPQLSVPGQQSYQQSYNGIPTPARRSMEDEQRPLPPGWVRQFDAQQNHQYFVDTKANPPRSIWHHPYDDDDFLRSLSSDERERIQDEESKLRRPLTPSGVDLKQNVDQKQPNASGLPPRSPSSNNVHSWPQQPVGAHAGQQQQQQQNKKKGFGEKFKEKVTGLTAEERAAEKRRQQQQEREYYEIHQKFRNALQQAQTTGQPVFLMKDKDGKDVYVEPPQHAAMPVGAYGGGFGAMGGGFGSYGGYPGRHGAPYGQNAYGVNPYQSGLYSNPNNKFIRPQAGYRRGGGGMALPIVGGVLGGLLLGDLLF